ncbi:hypothetical protein [Micromonospora sp. LOL_015]|uniref:hypothetical protein n=1 Tax=Micromonospora sp. LOL_015 TaxID=3345416 RepID=UPI003A871D6F
MIDEINHVAQLCRDVSKTQRAAALAVVELAQRRDMSCDQVHLLREHVLMTGPIPRREDSSPELVEDHSRQVSARRISDRAARRGCGDGESAEFTQQIVKMRHRAEVIDCRLLPGRRAASPWPQLSYGNRVTEPFGEHSRS